MSKFSAKDFMKKKSDIPNRNPADFFKKEYNQKKFDDFIPNLWKLSVNKEKKGHATIRFLPSFEKDFSNPFVQTFQYFIKAPQKGKPAFVQPGINPIHGEDVVFEYYRKLWAVADDDKSKARARRFNASQRYYVNVYIVDDPANPENNDTVKVLACSKQVYDMVAEAIAGDESAGLEGRNVLDIMEGYNFKYRATPVKGTTMYGYDKSEFEADSTALCDGDADKIQEVIDSCFELSEILNPEHYPTVEEYTEEFCRFMGAKSVKSLLGQVVDEDEDDRQILEDDDDSNADSDKEETPFEDDDDDDDVAW